MVFVLGGGRGGIIVVCGFAGTFGRKEHFHLGSVLCGTFTSKRRKVIVYVSEQDL